MFEEVMIVENKSEKTIYQYIRATKQFLEWLNKDFRYVKYEDCMMYLSWLTRSNKISASSIDNTRKFISPFFNWCFDNDYIQKNPFAKIKKMNRNPLKKDLFTDAEIVAMKDYCQNNNNKRELALVEFLLSTGVRVSECASINISDINWSKGEVQVYGKKTRTWRKVFLSTSALIHIREYLNLRNDKNQALFVSKFTETRLSSDRINAIIKEISKNTINRNASVHMFRKTLATRLHNKGMNIEHIARILGHSSTTCLRYYLTLDEGEMKYEYLKCA